jgi:two-component system OmpR family sensor kinase
VNALVVAHGGVASVRTAPDRGATFRIALPLAPEAQGGMADDDDLDEPGEAPDAPDTPGTPDQAWAPGGSTGEVTVTFGGKG